jgi:twinkle protein
VAGLPVPRLFQGRKIISTVIDGDTIDLSDYLEEKHDGENVRPASNFVEATIAQFYGEPSHAGALLPWSKTHEIIRLRPGEVTLWHGQNFSGKSLLTGHVATDLCWQGYRVCIASMEMLPAKTLQRMCRQAWGTNRPAVESIRQFHSWSDERLWLYDKRGSVDWKRLVAVVRYAVDKFEIQHFVIDSLMKCVKGEDDYNGQKDFVNALCAVAMDLNIHIHLIHHTAKPKEGHNPMPGRYDAKGSGSISDQVDNVVGIWRRRDDKTDDGQPDCFLNWDKQRNGEWDGKIALWYDPASFQYRGDRLGVASRQYLEGGR